jgi:hypothetical protein
MYRTALAAASLVLVNVGTTARAQWSPHATASLGRSYGNLALSQSILSGTRRLGSGANRVSAPARASATPGQIEAALGYTADPAVSDRTRTAMIERLSSDNPALRPYLEKSFADNAKLKAFDGLLSAHGISSRSAADSMAALLWASWEIIHGSTASPAQIRGIHQQVRGVFFGTPKLAGLSHAERQEWAERLAYQVMINVEANADAVNSGDPAQIAHIRQTVAGIVRQQAGIDLSALRLSDNGLQRKS